MNSVLLAHSRSTSRAYQRDADCNACGWSFARLDSQRTVRIHCREDVRDPLRNDVPAAQLYIGVVGADSSLPPHLFQPPQAECGLLPLWISWSSQRWYWARMRASLQSYSDTRFRTSLPWEQRRFHSMYPAVRVRWVLSVVFLMSSHGVVGYSLSSLQETKNGLTAQLDLAGPACDAFGQDIANLTLQVTYDSDTR